MRGTKAAEFRIRREMSAGFLSNFSSATWSFALVLSFGAAKESTQTLRAVSAGERVWFQLEGQMIIFR
jgi:hypothetical protein